MRMLLRAFRTINMTLFALERRRLKRPSWSARRVFVDTCDKNRIRKCAASNHRLAYGCLAWVARGDLVKFLPVQVRRGPSARETDSGNLNGECLNQVGGSDLSFAKASKTPKQPDWQKVVNFIYI